MESTKSGESDASSGEEPNPKRCRRDQSAVHAKNVNVLLDSDVSVSANNRNVVLMPNNIEMGWLKKPEKGQHGKINVTSEMTQMDVLTALLSQFPILRTKKRLGCASAADKRTRLDFHGDKRIWNGRLINKHTRGNSALYVYAEGNHESEESELLLEEPVLAATQKLKQLLEMSSTADQRHLTGNHDEPEMLQRGRIDLTTQADHTTGGVLQQGLSVVQKMQNDPVLQTIPDPVAQASLKSISMTSSSQQRKLIARTCKQGSSLQLFPPAEAAAHNNVPVEAFFPQTTSAKLPLAVSEGETTDSGIDSMLEIGSNHDTVQFRGAASVAVSGPFNKELVQNPSRHLKRASGKRKIGSETAQQESSSQQSHSGLAKQKKRNIEVLKQKQKKSSSTTVIPNSSITDLQQTDNQPLKMYQTLEDNTAKLGIFPWQTLSPGTTHLLGTTEGSSQQVQHWHKLVTGNIQRQVCYEGFQQSLSKPIITMGMPPLCMQSDLPVSTATVTQGGPPQQYSPVARVHLVEHETTDPNEPVHLAKQQQSRTVPIVSLKSVPHSNTERNQETAATQESRISGATSLKNFKQVPVTSATYTRLNMPSTRIPIELSSNLQVQPLSDIGLSPFTISSTAATQEIAQNSEPENSLKLALPPPAPAACKNVPVQGFKQDTSSNERKRKDSPPESQGLEVLIALSEGETEGSATESMWEESTNLDNFTGQSGDILTEICPNKGSIKGGDRFHLIVRGLVPEEIESFKAIFQGGGEVYLKKASLSTLAGETPSSKHGPGKVRVALMSSDGSWWGGECDFLYIEDPPTEDELLSMVVNDMDMLDKLCDKIPKEMSSSKPSDGQTSDFSGKTVPGSSSLNQSSYAWSVKLLQLLVYKAAEIDGQEFIQMIFSTSAGKVVFNNYRKSASLPEDVARANGHPALAYYLQDINSRLSKENSSDAGTETIDWMELKHAVNKEQSLTSGTEDAQISKKCQPPGYPESAGDGSDYFADDEISPSSSPCHNNACDSEDEDHSQNSKRSSGTDQSRYAWSVQVSQFVVNGLAQLHGHEFIQMIIRTSPEKEVLFYRKISAMSLVDATRANGLQLLADYYQQLVNNRLSKESKGDTRTEAFDWFELKHTVDKKQSLPLRESWSEKEVHEKDNHPVEDDDSSSFSLHVVEKVHVFQDIPSVKDENGESKHKQVTSGNVQSHIGEDDLQKENEMECANFKTNRNNLNVIAAQRGREVENWDTLGSEMMSTASNGTTGSHTAALPNNSSHNEKADVATNGSEYGCNGDPKEIKMIDDAEIAKSRDSKLSDVLKRHPCFLDQLALCLDKSMRLIPSWKQLARELYVDENVIKKMEQYKNQSPTIQLFEYLEVMKPQLTIQQLKNAMLDIRRNDLFSLLTTKGGFAGNGRVKDFMTTNPDSPWFSLLNEIALALDATSLVLANWYHLALNLGVPRKDSWMFEKRSSESPTNELFQYLEATHPQLTLKKLKESLRCINRMDLLHYLTRQYLEDEIFVKDILTPGSELLQTIADKLDCEIPGVMDWHHLASMLHVPLDISHTFGRLGPKGKSPTKEIMQWLVIQSPGTTLNDVLKALNKTQRYDAIHIITRKFPDTVDLSLELLDSSLCNRVSIDLPNNDPKGETLSPRYKREECDSFSGEQDSKLSDVLKHHPGFLDQLALCLDKSIRLIPNWKQLARELCVDEDVIKKMEQYRNQSPTIELFVYLELMKPQLTIRQLKNAMLDMGRNDLVSLLMTKGVLSGDERVKDVMTTDPNSPWPSLLDEIALALDAKSLVLENWYQLALKLGVPRKDSWMFERPSSQSPTNELFQYLEASRPQMTLKKLKESLHCINRMDLLHYLTHHYLEDEMFLKDIVTPGSELLQAMADKLDHEISGVMDWRHLASMLHVPLDVCHAFGRLGSKDKSPTKEIMQWLVARFPDTTLNDVLKALNKIQRYDAIHIITSQFPDTLVAEDLKQSGHGGNLPRPTYLVGRDDTCEHIFSLLSSSIAVIVVAPPGYGKTSVTIEVAHRMIERGKFVAYVNPQVVTCVEDLGSQIIEALGAVAGEDPVRETIRCLRALESKSVTLIIENIDNLLHLDDHVGDKKYSQESSTYCAKMSGKYKRADFLSFLKDIGQCPTIHLVLTSRETVDFSECFSSELIELKPLSHEDSRTLFMKQGDSLDDELVRELVGVCHGIPLLICTLSAILKEENRQIFTRKHMTSTVNPDFTTIRNSFDPCLQVYLNRLSKENQIVLVKISTFPHRFTQEQFLDVFKSRPVLDLQTCMNCLEHYKLVRFDQQRCSYSLHPFLRDFFSLMPQHTAAKSVFILHYSDLAMTLCKEFLSRDSKSAVECYRTEKENILEAMTWCGDDHPELDQTTREHCIRCFNKSAVFLAKMMRKQEFELLFGKLLDHCHTNRHLYSACLTNMAMKTVSSCTCTPYICPRAWHQAKSLLSRANNIQLSLTTFEDTTRAQCLSKLGYCFVREGSFDSGYDLLNQALALRKECVERSVKDEYKVMLAACHNDLAASQMMQRKHMAAIETRQLHVLPDFESILGNHPFVATTLSSMANSYQALGDYDNAIKFARRAFEMQERLPGEQLETARSLFDLGVALSAKKEYQSALESLEKAVALQEELLDTHEELMHTHQAMSVVLKGLGREEEAKREMELAGECAKILDSLEVPS